MMTNNKPASRKREKEKAGKNQLSVSYKLKPIPIETEDLADTKPTKAWQPPSYHNPAVLSQHALPSSSKPSKLPSTFTKPNPSSWQVVGAKKKSPTLPKATLADDQQYVPTHRSLTPTAQTAASLRRKGPLYQQAAAVYADRSQAESRAAHQVAFSNYLRHVDGQSSARKIDLHGVPVLDGVKIARDRVNAWWAGLDEYERERRKAAPGHELHIITGLGNHSVSGVSRLRQAVASMLGHGGWRFETGTGEFFVSGRLTVR